MLLALSFPICPNHQKSLIIVYEVGVFMGLHRHKSSSHHNKLVIQM